MTVVAQAVMWTFNPLLLYCLSLDGRQYLLNLINLIIMKNIIKYLFFIFPFYMASCSSEDLYNEDALQEENKEISPDNSEAEISDSSKEE